MDRNESFQIDFAVELEDDSGEEVDSKTGSRRRESDPTAGRHTKQSVHIWRGEDAIEQASNALGQQIAIIARQVSRHLDEAYRTGCNIDTTELEFGLKLKASAGKILGVFSLEGERTVKVKILLRRPTEELTSP